MASRKSIWVDVINMVENEMVMKNNWDRPAIQDQFMNERSFIESKRLKQCTPVCIAVARSRPQFAVTNLELVTLPH